eukprot:scaffold79555_cov65-Phaeocystis_antarctica.AAC.1
MLLRELRRPPNRQSGSGRPSSAPPRSGGVAAARASGRMHGRRSPSSWHTWGSPSGHRRRSRRLSSPRRAGPARMRRSSPRCPSHLHVPACRDRRRGSRAALCHSMAAPCHWPRTESTCGGRCWLAGRSRSGRACTAAAWTACGDGRPLTLPCQTWPRGLPQP